MGPWNAVAGAAILAIVAVDVVHTTLAEGAGPVTRRITALLWSLARRLVPRRRFRHRALAAAGALTILTTIFCWFVLVWLGWGLILCAERDAVVTQADQTPAAWPERFYYTGFVMVTLTLEDHEPGEDFYKVITVLATANGFSILTLSLAYLLPVVQAATHKRKVALTVSTLGGTADEILLRAWDGRGFETLTPYLRDLVAEINLLTERHQTYPVLHYLHPRQRDSAPAPMVAVLDEALTLLTRAVTPDHRPPRAVHETLRRALTRYLTTLRIAYISPVDRTPPPPDRRHGSRSTALFLLLQLWRLGFSWSSHLGGRAMSDHPDPSPDDARPTELTEPPRAKRKRRPRMSPKRKREAPDLARSGRGWPAEPAGSWTI